MSAKYPTQHEQAQLVSACEKCQAPVGEWCKTERGGQAVYLHVVRGSR